jgi:CRISPR-associated endonuclease/helicase Cas3
LDAKKIVHKLTINDRKTLSVQFRSAAEAFRLIDDADSAAVVVRYPEYREKLDRRRGITSIMAKHCAENREDVEKLLRILVAKGPTRWLMRSLQRYTISIPQKLADKMHKQGDLTLPMPGLYVLADADNLYDFVLGLKLESDLYDPSRFFS